jgi:hypothetical protein
MRSVYKTFVGIAERKRPLGRPWHRWRVNIRMDVRKMG